MGCVSSCFRVEDIDEYMNPNSSVYRNCPCIRCLAHNFLNLVRSSHCLVQLMLSYGQKSQKFSCFHRVLVTIIYFDL